MFCTLRSLAVLSLTLTTAAVGCVGNHDSGESDQDEVGDSESDLATPSFPSDATPPSYDDIANLTGDAFKSAIFDRIKNHRSLGYNAARKQMFARGAKGFFNDNGKLECVYTGREVDATGSTGVGGFNTEHSWPQSMGAKNEPAKSDLHHLFPVDGHANSVRGNWPFGEPSCAADTTGQSGHCSFGEGGSFFGKDTTGKNVFEVREEKRGDIARAHFYFAIRYNLHIGATEEAVLRQWNTDDPVDATELRRNAAVQALQNNRNPFVDRPDFVAKIADF